MATGRGRTRRRTRRRRRAGARIPRAGLLVVALAVALVAAVWVIPSPGSRPDAARPTAAPTRTPSPVLAGADVSWPSCRHPTRNPLPAPAAFGIVGVNDGVPGTRNPCLDEQVAWAAAASGGSTQPRVGYYVIAADPFSPWEARWAKPVWPKGAAWRGRTQSVPAAWGACRGGRAERGCAWLFGWRIAWRDAHLAGVVDPQAATWWLDVETIRDWSDDTLWNQAMIEGMAAAFASPAAEGGVGARVGIYSNAYFWTSIAGPLRTRSPLAGLPNWYPIGEATIAEATSALSELTPVTPGGRIEIVQHVEAGVDRNVAAVRR